MPYIDRNTGEQRYSLKEKFAYHKALANSGKNIDGTNMSFTQRNNHAESARRCQSKLGRYVRGAKKYAGYKG